MSNRLFIRVQDGKAINHPIVESNFDLAFPDIDKNNLPDGFMEFKRVEQPYLGPYKKNYRVEYEIVDGVMTDVWYADDMEPQEVLDLRAQRKAEWAVSGFASWTFNEDTCLHEPPVEYPDDGLNYRWDEATTSWVEIT